MSARILVVDDNPLNVKLLEAKLAKDYYVVSTAENGAKALEKVKTEKPDLILLDIMMPEMDGFEACRRLKADPETKHIPVVMVTALSDTADRVKGLGLGADDFLTKPINDIALMARVRSLLRLKMIMDEWRLREETAAQFDFPMEEKSKEAETGTVLLLEDDAHDREVIEANLRAVGIICNRADNSKMLLETASEGGCDMAMISTNLMDEDGLYLCAQLRSKDTTRMLPIILVANQDQIDLVAKGMDLGANDYLMRPLEATEMITRTRTQLRQKRHYDHLRGNYAKSLSLALVDPLTGAYNRRYMDNHLPRMINHTQESKGSLSVICFDLDHFKQVNDTYGHAAGDEVLKEVINRVEKNIRPHDLIVRQGGEEFAVILPETGTKTALMVGERLRAAIAAQPVKTENDQIPITVSLGVSFLKLDENDTAEHLLERADGALYKAKETGRNKVVGDGIEEIPSAPEA